MDDWHYMKDKDCPSFICVECPICGIFVGETYCLHPPSNGVKIKDRNGSKK